MAPTPSSPSSPPTSSSRRQSHDDSSRQIASIAPQDRIDSILDTARRRSVALRSPSKPHTMPGSPPPPDDGPLLEAAESSADDQTPIAHRENNGRGRGGMNYQATASGGVPADALRSRKSPPSVRRDSERRPLPPQDLPEDENEVHDESWWQRQLAKYGSIELENKGSVARDHLALERTFLAWLRTSLAFASIGIAITQLFRLNTSISNGTNPADPFQHLRQLGKPLGATFLAISIVVLFVGFHRYFESQHWIIRGKFPASRGSIALVAAIALALMVTSLAVVLVVEPGSYEKRDVFTGIFVQ